MTRIALVTARAARGTDFDMPPLLAALRAAGADADAVAWDDPGTDWSRFDVAVLRSTWDYVERLPEFLAWADCTARHTRLLNPPDVIRWNTDKHYLADLAQTGVPVVPGKFVEPGANAGAAVDAFLQHLPGEPPPAGAGIASRDVVVKPAVGAGSHDAQRHACSARDAIVAHVQRLLVKRRSVLLQPYLDRVDAQGETALLFFNGAFSHAIRKGPLLRRGAPSAAPGHVTESIAPRTPIAAELSVARSALDAIPFTRPLLYARVDLIHADDGTPRLLELELTEPSVFVAQAAGAAARLAAAIVDRAR
ncbi:MAG TPA: hypothetical protein VF292_08705 [Rhodanobacteraceae bacterium]